MSTDKLNVGDFGDDVTRLHEKLKGRGFEVSPEEVKRKFYGPATRDAVRECQTCHGLEITGEVNDATAAALSARLPNGVAASAPTAVPFVIAPPPGTVSQGAQATPRPPSGGGDAGGESDKHQVQGRIYFDHGLPGSGLTLRVYNRGYGGTESPLGEIKTDAHGEYALSYDPDGKAANIEVRVVDAQGKEIPLSDTKFNADKQEMLNLVAPAGVQPLPPEYLRLSADLVNPLGDLKLADAREDDERQDLTLLHESTGWDARLIAVAATANKLSTDTGISQDALYALFRAGLPDAPEALALVSTDAFETALTRAKEAGVIAIDDAQMVAAKTAFESFRFDTLRKTIVPGALSSVGELLDKARIEQTHKATFEKLVLIHDGDDAALWAEAKAQSIPDEQIASLQLQGKLAFLTLNNAPLTDALQTEITSQDNLTLLVEKDLYRKEDWVTRLNALAGNDAATHDANLAQLIPPAYAQKELRARLDAYADDLARKVRQSFPTHVVTRMLAKDELKLGAQHAEMKAPVQTFLKNTVDIGFQLGRTPVDQFLKQHSETAFDGIAEDQKDLAEAGAKLLTRTYQMTPNDEAMTTLHALGFTSARQVIAIEKADFVERYWERFGSRRVTETVYDKSVQISSVTFNVYTLGKKIDSTPPIMAISGPPEKHKEAKDNLKSLLKEYPTMETLFGSLDFCECEHCRSVLSPAAYLVDLLRFVDAPINDWQHTLDYWKETHGKDYVSDYNFLKPYDALVLRRPDLPHLPLTCENTNTALPYIDLVNEILEYFVANSQLDANAAHDTGEATSAELMAEPQNIIPNAYDTLKGARYPLTLPFDLWLETVRRFCKYFEMPFWQVLDTFRPSDDLYAPAANPEAYYRAQIFAEYLGLSPDEYAIYISSTTANWLKLYGYDSDTETSALAKLKSAKTLSHRLSVSYIELTELMKTAFVNPKLNSLVTLRKLGVGVSDVFRYKKQAGYAPFVLEEEAEFDKRLAQLTEKFKPNFDAKQWLTDSWDQHQFEKVLVLRGPDVGCSFDETTVCYVNAPDAGLDALDYMKLNLFVRLSKRLGGTIEETDRALQAFLPADGVMSDATLSNAMKTALIYLARLKELTELISVGNDGRMKLLMLWTDLAAKGTNSLYAQLFLTCNILKDDAVFDDPLGNYLSKPDVFVKDHLPALQAALNLTANEITQILRDGNTGDESDVDNAKLSLANVSMLYRYGLLAMGLKISISEVIALKALSGLDPFKPLLVHPLDEKIKNDYPFTQTLAFVRSVQQVKASGFSISDLDYLIRHHVDPLGKYRDDNPARLAWIRVLAAELRTVADDYAVPTSADSLTDEALQLKMSFIFAPDAVQQFMTFWLNTYSATKEHVSRGQRLTPATYAINGVSVAYNDADQTQQVTYFGVLTAAAKVALLAQIPQPAPADQDAGDARHNFSELLDQIVEKSTVQGEEFFSKYFDGLLKFDDFFGLGVITTMAEKRLRLLQELLPFLQSKLTHQKVVQALTTQTGGDVALIETLLMNNDFLALPDAITKPLVARFEELALRGLTTVLTPSATDAQLITKLAEDVDIIESDKCKQARWSGFIEVPQSGTYRFYAQLGKKNATANLRFDTAIDPVLTGQAAKNNDVINGLIELQAGVSYGVTLEVSNLQDGTFQLLVKGETTAKEKLSTLVMMPRAAVEGAVAAYTMLAKALQLAQGLALSERDVHYVLAHPSDFGAVDWRLLPTQPTADTDSDSANAAKLFKGLMALMDYAALKRDAAGGGDDFVAIFESARLKNPESVLELCTRIATLTRRNPDVVQATATELKMTEPEHFADNARMERLWRALQIVEKFGLSVESLKTWLTPQPDASVAMQVRNTIKSRYDPETWQRIAKGIFDPLRQRQRDALVTHIMHIKEDEGVDSVEKLFEYFLIDPGMEPVVQTSRLRLAISSLQTFIQRCFLNLEPRVHPSVLNAQHWSWMKRYRVWEANRKIFLFPENWLEPEWRDDKTHLYQELESSLLQGDVTNQLAEDALYVYLKKLDQLARLEIVTTYAEEKPLGPPTIHVIGRTYLTPHQYFYRRYARQMWTPWEPLTADIDGDHIVAAMWRERLHLFWLTFMERVEESEGGAQTGESRPLGELPAGDLVKAAVQTSKGAVRRMLDVQLNWSEYFQGAWTARESSGFSWGGLLFQPLDATKVFVTVSKETDPETGADGAVWINLNGLSEQLFHINYPGTFPATSYFRVVSKNSRPQLESNALPEPTSPYLAPETKTYNRYTGSGALSVTFVSKIVTTDGKVLADPPAPQTILSKSASEYILLPSSNRMLLPNAEFAPLISPVFYADNVNTFFVEPSLTETTINTWQGYTITRPSQRPKWAAYVKDPPHISPVISSKYLHEALKLPEQTPQPDPIDALARYAIKPNRDARTQPSIAIQFGDTIVGRTGRLQDVSDIKQVITSLGGVNR